MEQITENEVLAATLGLDLDEYKYGVHQVGYGRYGDFSDWLVIGPKTEYGRATIAACRYNAAINHFHAETSAKLIARLLNEARDRGEI